MSSSFVSIGIDVSKEGLDIHTPQEYFSIDNNTVAIEEWLSTLKRHRQVNLKLRILGKKLGKDQM